MKISLEKLRHEYGNHPLLEVHEDPFDQFQEWFKEACIFEPNGMTLSTVSPKGHPSSRTVLLKEVDRKGLVFFTSYNSRKGKQLAANPHASLTFWWREIFRQVLIEGKVEKISRKASIAYFAKRPKGAQIAALASDQSEPTTRPELEETFNILQRKYRGKKVPCPPDWGGYRLVPSRFEFWQGRKNRLHDRFCYIKTHHRWLISRLCP